MSQCLPIATSGSDPDNATAIDAMREDRPTTISAAGPVAASQLAHVPGLLRRPLQPGHALELRGVGLVNPPPQLIGALQPVQHARFGENHHWPAQPPSTLTSLGSASVPLLNSTYA